MSPAPWSKNPKCLPLRGFKLAKNSPKPIFLTNICKTLPIYIYTIDTINTSSQSSALEEMRPCGSRRAFAYRTFHRRKPAHITYENVLHFTRSVNKQRYIGGVLVNGGSGQMGPLKDSGWLVRFLAHGPLSDCDAGCIRRAACSWGGVVAHIAFFRKLMLPSCFVFLFLLCAVWGLVQEGFLFFCFAFK